MENLFDLIVLGAGSGGLAAAKRAAGYGAKVAIIEGDRIGGTCVVRGCVPKKLLVYGSMYSEHFENAASYGVNLNEAKINAEVLLKNVRGEVSRLSQLHEKFLSNFGIEIIRGWGSFSSCNSVVVSDLNNAEPIKEIYGKNILIAVGGRPKRPSITGASKGWVSDDIFLLQKLPSKMVVVGAGYIACEFSCILKGLGVEVIQLIRGTHLLKGFDLELSEILRDGMLKKGIRCSFNESLKKIEGHSGDFTAKTMNNEYINCGGILFATGREPFLEGLALENAGVNPHEGKIKVDANNQTVASNVFAIGDVTDRINLTPVAIDEGRAFSDRIFGNKHRCINYELVPRAVFSQPEIASVGISEEEATEKHGKENINIFRSKFFPMSRVLSRLGTHCLLKLVVDKNTNKILGAHMVGEHAAEIIQMASISLLMGATKSDFDKTMALHPTISEEFVTMQ